MGHYEHAYEHDELQRRTPYKSVWEAIEGPHRAPLIGARSTVSSAIERRVRDKTLGFTTIGRYNWLRKQCEGSGLNIDVVEDIVYGKFSKMSLDTLVVMATVIGLTVNITTE